MFAANRDPNSWQLQTRPQIEDAAICNRDGEPQNLSADRRSPEVNLPAQMVIASPPVVQLPPCTVTQSEDDIRIQPVLIKLGYAGGGST